MSLVSRRERTDESLIFEELENPREIDEQRMLNLLGSIPSMCSISRSGSGSAREQQRGQQSQSGSSSTPMKAEEEFEEEEDDDYYGGVEWMALYDSTEDEGKDE